MGKTRVTENELLEALRQAAPTPPPPPWMTMKELEAALKMSEAMVRRRIGLLKTEGRLEKRIGPKRDAGPGGGSTMYYRLKADGKKPLQSREPWERELEPASESENAQAPHNDDTAHIGRRFLRAQQSHLHRGKKP